MGLARDSNGRIAQVVRLGASTNLATSTSSIALAVQSDACWAIRLVASVDTRIVISSGGPTATASSTLLVAGQSEYFACVKGESVAAYSVTAGSLNVVELV